MVWPGCADFDNSEIASPMNLRYYVGFLIRISLSWGLARGSLTRLTVSAQITAVTSSDWLQHTVAPIVSYKPSEPRQGEPKLPKKDYEGAF